MALLHAFACKDLCVVEPWCCRYTKAVGPRLCKALPESGHTTTDNEFVSTVSRPQLPDVEWHLLHPSMITVAYGQASLIHCTHTFAVADDATMPRLCPTFHLCEFCYFYGPRYKAVHMWPYLLSSPSISAGLATASAVAHRTFKRSPRSQSCRELCPA